MKLPKPFELFTTYTGHSGYDFPVKLGTPIPALGDGIVTFVGWNKGIEGGNYNRPGKDSGNTRDILYGNVKARFSHLDSLEGPQLNERVTYGQIVGYVGSTGKSTGPHLHMEVWVNGRICKGTEFWKYVDVRAVAILGAVASVPIETVSVSEIEGLKDMTNLRVIDSPHYRAKGERVIHNGHSAVNIPAGWAQPLVNGGGVDFHAYDTDNALITEVNLVHMLAGLSEDAAARKTAELIGKL